MKPYIPSFLVIALFICFTSCQQDSAKVQAPKEAPEQNTNDSVAANRAINNLVEKIAASSIYNKYDSLRAVINFEKKIAYDEYLTTRKQNNNEAIVELLNNNNMALAKKREALEKLGFKLSYEYERVSISLVLIKTKLLNTFPELLNMDTPQQDHVLQLVTEKKSRGVQSPI